MTHIRKVLASVALAVPLLSAAAPAAASTSYAGEVPLDFDARDEWRLAYNDYEPGSGRADLTLKFIAPAVSDYTEIDLDSISSLSIGSNYAGKPLDLDQFENLREFTIAPPPEQSLRYKADVDIEDGSILTLARPIAECENHGNAMLEDLFIVLLDAQTAAGEPVQIAVEADLSSYEREVIESFRASCDAEDVAYYEQQRAERESTAAADEAPSPAAAETKDDLAAAPNESSADVLPFILTGAGGVLAGAMLTQIINIAYRRRTKELSK